MLLSHPRARVDDAVRGMKIYVEEADVSEDTKDVTDPERLEEGLSPHCDVTGELYAAMLSDTGVEVERLVRDHPVLLFSCLGCPFSDDLKAMLQRRHVAFTVAEVSELGLDKIAVVESKLDHLSGLRTFPHLFVRGTSLRGPRDVKKLQQSGELDAYLAEFTPSDLKPLPELERVQRTGLFGFPHTVDAHVMRGVAALVALVALFCIIFYRSFVTRYVVLGLTLDAALRVAAGVRLSPLGMLAKLAFARLKPRFAPGPPKQAAALVHLVLSAWAAGFFLAGWRLAGDVMLGLLLSTAGFDAFFGQCIGCFVLRQGYRCGLVPEGVMRVHLGLVEDEAWAYEWSHQRRRPPTVPNSRILLPHQAHETAADLVRKDRVRAETKLEDVSCIRHTTVSFFFAPAAVAALGMVLRFAHTGFATATPGKWLAAQVWQAVTGFAGILFGALLLLYTVRLVLAPRKVWKEFRHPHLSAGFSAICMTFVFSALAMAEVDGAVDTRHALLWLGAAPQMLLTVLRVSDLVHHRHTDSALAPSALATPMGNLVAALGIATYAGSDGVESSVDYRELASFWFGSGAVFTVVLFVLSVRKAVINQAFDEGARSLHWLWLAASSVLGPAAATVSAESIDAVAATAAYQSVFGLSLFLLLLLLDGCRRGFYRLTDSRSNFVGALALCLFAFSTLQLYSFEATGLTEALAVGSLALAATATSVCLLHSLVELFGGTLFIPAEKWSPASFMELSHEAFRAGLPKAGKLIANMDQDKPETIQAATAALSEVCFVMVEHTRQEEMVVFPYARRFFPGLGYDMDDEHSTMHGMLDMFGRMVQDFAAGEMAPEHAAFLQENYDAWVVQATAHLRHEEATMDAVLRKYMPEKMQRELLTRVWQASSIAAWERLVPFALRNLPHPMWQVRYLQTLCWAMPERCQEVGLIVYRHVESAQWVSLAERIPEMVPRGVPGHLKLY